MSPNISSIHPSLKENRNTQDFSNFFANQKAPLNLLCLGLSVLAYINLGSVHCCILFLGNGAQRTASLLYSKLALYIFFSLSVWGPRVHTQQILKVIPLLCIFY